LCTIAGADPTATRKNTWVIKFEDDGSTRVAVKFQQLLRLSDEDLHAALSINSTSEEETEPTAPESENDSDLEGKNDSDLEGDFELDDETSDVDPDNVAHPCGNRKRRSDG